MTPTFTVLTPTYNRAHTLARVWDSLRAQTFRSFEWVVIDDGSSDGTDALIARWAAEAPFPVRYLRQENRGKHIALNRGVAASSGEMIVILDSDDACVPEALERFAFHWRAIPDDRRSTFYGVVCHCADPEGRRVGDPFPQDVIDALGLDARYIWKVRGEKWGTVRADLMRALPFPEEKIKTYIPEGVVWDRLGRTYRARFVNEALRVYHLEPGAGSLGTPGDPARNAWGNVLQYRVVLNEQLGYFRAAPREILAAAAQYVRFSRHAGIPAREQRRALASRAGKLLWWIAAPVGLAAWAFDRRRRWTSS